MLEASYCQFGLFQDIFTIAFWAAKRLVEGNSIEIQAYIFTPQDKQTHQQSHITNHLPSQPQRTNSRTKHNNRFWRLGQEIYHSTQHIHFRHFVLWNKPGREVLDNCWQEPGGATLRLAFLFPTSAKWWCSPFHPCWCQDKAEDHEPPFIFPSDKVDVSYHKKFPLPRSSVSINIHSSKASLFIYRSQLTPNNNPKCLFLKL